MKIENKKTAKTAKNKCGRIGRKRKQQLIDATIMSLDRHGLSNTTTETISKIAGLSKGTIHHHFESKEDLLLSAMKYLIREISANVLKTLASKSDPLEKVREILVHLMVPKTFEKHEFNAWMFFWIESINNEELGRLLSIYRRRLKSNLTHELNIVFDRETSKYLAEIFHRAANGFWLEICLSGDPDFNVEVQKATRMFSDMTDLHLLLNRREPITATDEIAEI